MKAKRTAIPVIQGTQEWHNWRAGIITASKASKIMKGQTEGLFVNEYEADEGNLAYIFQRGHDEEYIARKRMEIALKEPLYPACIQYGKYGASLDGMTLSGSIIWEHKLFNKSIYTGYSTSHEPAEAHAWQMLKALYVSGADKCFFTMSDSVKRKWITRMFTVKMLEQAGYSTKHMLESCEAVLIDKSAPAPKKPKYAGV